MTLALALPAAAEGADHILRVGFYAYTGYNVTDADGNRSGYSYDLLQQIADHENITYTYTGYDCSTSEALELLRNGEVDLVPIVRKTPEREEEFAFSAEPVASLATMVTIRAGNRNIVAGDYATYDGMVVGMSRRGNGRNESFETFAAEKGFSYTAVYFDTDEELSAALSSGNITAAVSNRFRQTENEWILETFGEEDVYIATRKDDIRTQQLINDAILQMDRDDPSWRMELFNKYYNGTHTSSKIFLTEEEENYVLKKNATATVFTVLANPDRYPYSYTDRDGAPTGILVDLFKKLADRARIHYKFLTPADRNEYEDMMASGQADFCIDLTDDLSHAEDYGYRLTDSYVQARCSWVLLKQHGSSDLYKVGVVQSALTRGLTMPGLPTNATVEYFDSFDDCLTALRSGSIDAYYTYTYQAEQIVAEEVRNDLMTRLSDEQVNFCIGVSSRYDTTLHNIMNKSVDSLVHNDVVEATNRYTTMGNQSFSLIRLFYQYPLVIALVAVCFVVLLICVALLARARIYREQMVTALHKAEEASAAKTEFLSNMSHDIRTPINGIMGMLDIAEDNFDDKIRVADCLKKMRGAASHLLSLINDVLDMSKIESGSMKMLNNPFDLRVLLDSCCAIVEGQIIERNLTFNKQIGPFWHPYLIGSELHIRQVLINILSNAVKYTPDGGEITLRAKETLCEEGLVHLRMEIQDSGIGMSEEFLQHIFEPFTQEERSSRTSYKGTGLGMAITKKLVDQMHGSLDVESEPGKGSTFIVRLSLPLGTRPKTEAPVAAKPDLHGLHLLLAEDNELNSEIAVTLLTEEGAEVTAVTNGREAVEAMQNAAPGTYDAILMDIMMPEMNGLEATRHIRALEGVGPELGTPIIAMTANVFADDVKACLDAGMNSHVGKPLDMKVLMAEILRWVNMRRG